MKGSSVSAMGYLLKQTEVTTLVTGKTVDNNVFPDPANHLTAKTYLMEDVYPTLDRVLNELLSAIESNGEYEKYVDMLAERQERAQKELRKRERERRRLEMGDDYDSQEEAKTYGVDEQSSSSSSSSESSSESESEHKVKKFKEGGAQEAMRVKKELRQSGKKSATKMLTPELIAQEVAKEFNPVRFIGQALKRVAQEEARQRVQ